MILALHALPIARHWRRRQAGTQTQLTVISVLPPSSLSWNTHFSTVVEQELFGCGAAAVGAPTQTSLAAHRRTSLPTSWPCRLDFQLAQDPNSSNLGTTVWDASIVLAKYIEKVSRRVCVQGRRTGRSRVLVGRRRPPCRQQPRSPACGRCSWRAEQPAWRLLPPQDPREARARAGRGHGAGGHGAGAAGSECAAGRCRDAHARRRQCGRAACCPPSGPMVQWRNGPPPTAEVTFTDIGDVLPLLRRNVEQNISKAALKRELAVATAAPATRARGLPAMLVPRPSHAATSLPPAPQLRTRRGWRPRWVQPPWRRWTGQTRPATQPSARPTTLFWLPTASTASSLVRRGGERAREGTARLWVLGAPPPTQC